jgi:secondary thiamine-phosphate synthase enzyme
MALSSTKPTAEQPAMPHLSSISRATGELTTAIATLTVPTPGEGFTDITADVAAFVRESGAGTGVLFLFIRHTSASLVIQENADPDVQTDLRSALRTIAPEDTPWVHHLEGPDDMPAHVRTMLTGVTLHVPVIEGRLALGTWQAIYGRAPRRSASARGRALLRRQPPMIRLPRWPRQRDAPSAAYRARTARVSTYTAAPNTAKAPSAAR